MLDFIVKTSKIGFWILLPLFLISNKNVAYEVPTGQSGEIGSYRLRTSGAFNKILTGHMVFEREVNVLSKGDSIARLELNLDQSEESTGHSMGFVLSKQVSDTDDLEGYYEVSVKSAGFSNNTDGVFGFADISSLGEQPFFTTSGRVHITAVTGDLVHGKINIGLRNFQGSTIGISGNFIAKRSK